MPTTQYKIRLLKATLIISIVLTFAKFAAYLLTHSNAILTDALESIVNVFAGGFALYSVIIASKPKDKDHPYGHGKIEFLSAGLEGSLIMLASLVIIGKALYGFLHPQKIHDLDIGIYITLGVGLVNFGIGRFLVKTGKNHNSLTLVADGKHLMTDAYSSLGILIGLIIVYFTNLSWLDNALAIVFGLLVGFTGYKIFRAYVSGVMDEADEEALDQVIKILSKHRKDEWIDVHNLRIIRYGGLFHIDCHVTLPWYYNVYKAHEAIKEVEHLINEEIPSTEIFIHIDPCLPESCSICNVQDCAYRLHPFQKKVDWDLRNVIENEKHRL